MGIKIDAVEYPIVYRLAHNSCCKRETKRLVYGLWLIVRSYFIFGTQAN